MKTLAKIILPFLIISLILGGCAEENPNEPKAQDVVPLPPTESMAVDLSAFVNTSLAKADGSESKTNYANAVARVAFINVSVAIGLAAPTAVFGAAISQVPTLEADGKFHWVYQTAASGYTYEADLAGWINQQDKKANWEMYVTVPTFNPALDKFMWYNGWSEISNNKGQWKFYDAATPNEANQIFTIDWTVVDSTDFELEITNTFEASGNNGDVLTYSGNGTERRIEFMDQDTGELSIIVWDYETTAGYLKVPNYNDGNPAYWDENHNDVEGP